MDYLRVYAEFIADRRAREPGLTGYAERHHIVPRSLGGGDEAANLIRLTPEDHYFAHLLLAKVHGGRNWAAVHAMCHLANERSGAGRSRLTNRTQFGHVRRALAEYYRATLGGPDGKIADKRQYTLRHFDGREATGNRFALEQQAGIPRQQISAILRGAKGEAHGWYCPVQNPAGQSAKERFAAGVRNRARVTLWHHDGRVWTGTKADFRDMTGAGLVDRRDNVLGWYKTPEAAAQHYAARAGKARSVASARGDISGRANPNADPQQYRFLVVQTGEVVTATKYEVRSRFSLTAAQLCALFNGRQRQTGGVALAEETSEIAARRAARQKSRRQEHRVD